MLRCARCDKAIRECCDIFYPVLDENNVESVVCGECAAELEEAADLWEE